MNAVMIAQMLCIHSFADKFAQNYFDWWRICIVIHLSFDINVQYVALGFIVDSIRRQIESGKSSSSAKLISPKTISRQTCVDQIFEYFLEVKWK